MSNLYLGDILIAGDDLIPASNYVRHRGGNNKPISVDATGHVTLPKMSLCTPDGRDENTQKLKNRNVFIPGGEYSIDNYNVISTDGSYPLIYRELKDEHSFFITPLYSIYESNLPNRAPRYATSYMTDNTMRIQDAPQPNYSVSSGVSVTKDGSVSSLGTLRMLGIRDFEIGTFLNLDFSPPDNITTETQDLFTIPFAKGILKGNKVEVAVYTTAYEVSYRDNIFSGNYTFEGSTTHWTYVLGVPGEELVYTTDEEIVVGSILYEGTEAFGKVAALDKTTKEILVRDISTNKILYPENSTGNLGPYTDESYITYKYLLGTSQVCYAPEPIQVDTELFTDESLVNGFGIVADLGTSGDTLTVTVTSEENNIGYTSRPFVSSSTERLPEGTPIFNDSNLQNLVKNSTGTDSKYVGVFSRAEEFTFKSSSLEVTPGVRYNLNLSFNENDSKFHLDFNGTGATLLGEVKGAPYIEDNSYLLGGSLGFAGSIFIGDHSGSQTNGTYLSNGSEICWEWNKVIEGTEGNIKWEEAVACKVGTAVVFGGAVHSVYLDEPIEVLKVSDLKKLSTQIAYPVGVPQFTLNFDNSSLPDDCIWLEGQTVQQADYPELYSIYGNEYGETGDADTFKLPNFKGRCLWGATTIEDGPYLEAAIPNIKGAIWAHKGSSGAFYQKGGDKWHGNRNNNADKKWTGFDASRSSAVYKDDATTVQPPSIKVRVFTRYR